MLSEFQWEKIGTCVCGADVFATEDCADIKAPNCICNYNDFEFSDHKPLTGFRLMAPCPDAVFVRDSERKVV